MSFTSRSLCLLLDIPMFHQDFPYESHSEKSLSGLFSFCLRSPILIPSINHNPINVLFIPYEFHIFHVYIYI